MTLDPTSETTRTYDHIAANYAARWQERGVLAAQIARFMALIPAGGLVCDIGCGPGFDTAVLRQHGFRAIGLDRSRGMMQAGREVHGPTLPFVQMDMRALPLAKTAVYGLWASASLLHLLRQDMLPALCGFARVLKPGGVLYLSLKAGAEADWQPNPYQNEGLRFFTYWQPDTLDPLLIQAGFHIVDGWLDQSKRTHWLVRYAQLADHLPHQLTD